MKVLWLCNIMLPVVARQLGVEASNKEGWVSGMAETVLAHQHENGVELSVAFPISLGLQPEGGILKGVAAVEFIEDGAAGSFAYYGFPEDVRHPEYYDKALEERLKSILNMAKPDIVHCFGTEYPHTLAMCRIFPQKDKLLIGIQGICALYAEAYYADLPENIIRSITLRDFLKKDSLIRQQEKFVLRGKMEREAVGLAGNITGRTQWDKACVEEWNPKASYFAMNETLRAEFYGANWDAEKCIPYSIFLSQGDYPIKGLHYMLKALPAVLAEYPSTIVYVAGNSLVDYKTLKDKLKLSAYGKYLRRLIGENHLEDHVVFLGKLDAEQMRDRYLKSSLFVCCSSIENSPNSLGEAMLLGMPCVSAAVGGIPSIFNGDEDGILYEGFQFQKNTYRNHIWYEKDGIFYESFQLSEIIAGHLAAAVISIWKNPEKTRWYCGNAKRHAAKTHDKVRNYNRLLEIYNDIYGKKQQR